MLLALLKLETVEIVKRIKTRPMGEMGMELFDYLLQFEKF
jgi:hypothetical protein